MTRVPSLGREDPLTKEMTAHSSILAWENFMDRGTWRATVHGVAELDRTECMAQANTTSDGIYSMSCAERKAFPAHVASAEEKLFPRRKTDPIFPPVWRPL